MWPTPPSAINDIQLRVCLPGETEWKEYTSGSFKVTKKQKTSVKINHKTLGKIHVIPDL